MRLTLGERLSLVDGGPGPYETNLEMGWPGAIRTARAT